MNDPIFIHASARSGSTFIYNALRKNKNLMVFNEAIIDGKRDYMSFPRTLNGPSGWVNQDFLTEPDYIEFLDAPEAMKLCPEFPTFNGWTEELHCYIRALILTARSYNKRPVFCEINSRPLAHHIKKAFGGFHCTQVRNFPDQFGSCVRALVDGGTWGFLAHPLLELAIYSPELGTPSFPWDTSSRAAHWISDARVTAFTTRQSIDKLRHWHLLSYTINNHRAQQVSERTLDIDNPSQPLPVEIDWSGYQRFPRNAYPSINEAEWTIIQRKHHKLWHNSIIRWLAGKSYPWAAPFGRQLRSMGVPI